MGPEGIILVNSPITTFQQSLTHSALFIFVLSKRKGRPHYLVEGIAWIS